MNVQTPTRVESQLTDKGYVPVYTTAVVEQPWDSYTPEDHEVWKILYARQQEVLKGRASDEFLRTQREMGMSPDQIPKFQDINKLLMDATGWQLIGVEGLLPELDFFEHLANRRFPVTWWIRRMDQLDYLSEPDLFHDLFGHVPLLMNPVFANYMAAYGRGGVKAHGIAEAARAAATTVVDGVEHFDEAKALSLGSDALTNLTRLYWYTVEFGLIRQADGLRIYGSGIVSSKGESIYSLESDAPNRIGFNLERIMRTKYRIDTYQKTYFVIDSYEQLMEATFPDFTPIYQKLSKENAIPAGNVLSTDVVFNEGTGEGWLTDGDV